MTKPIKPRFSATVTTPGAVPFTVTVTGRCAWAMLSLLRAGAKGCTPIDRPAPRWSDYVFRLRKLGVPVETIDENHGGPYSGQHARYCLKAMVTIGGGNLIEFLASPEGRREFPNLTVGEPA